MTTLQDILGLITKRKIKTPSDNDYIISAAYSDTQEVLKPQPKMEASLLNIGALKKYILASITPPTYKVYTALVNQAGTNAPVFTILENSLELTFTINRDFAGQYTIFNFNKPLPLNKTTVDIGISKATSNFGETKFNVNAVQSTSTAIQINTFFAIASTWSRADTCLNNTLIEIRVYN